MKGKTLVRLAVFVLGVSLLLGCDTGLRQEDFRKIAGGGVDDRINSYPWAMEQFDGNRDGTPEIYIGTIANALCLQAPLMSWVELVLPGFQLLPPERWQCRNDLWGDPTDLASWEPYFQATYAPARVFRGTYKQGKCRWKWEHAWDPPLEQVNGFRGARVFEDALYLTGNGPQHSYIYKTTDGVHFEKASPAGMGTIAGQSGFRGAQVFKGKLYVSSDKACMIFCSPDPSTDPDSWQQANSTGFVASGGGTHGGLYDSGTVTAATAGTLTDDTKSWGPFVHQGRQVRITAGAGQGQSLTILANDVTTLTLAGIWETIPDPTSEYEIFESAAPDNQAIWQLAVFHDHLYAITWNFVTGPECWKSSDPAPGNWVRVIQGGFGNPNVGFMSIRPFRDHVYIGTATYPPLFAGGAGIEGTEILRVDADDKVELVVGRTRQAGVVGPDPVEPLSGIGAGFGHLTNFYTWTLGEYDGWFYAGTCDFNGMGWDYFEDFFGGGIPPGWERFSTLLFGKTGFDLWRTADGVEWIQVSDTGFDAHDNYGIRNLMATQWGFFVGVANAVDGFEVWLGKRD